MTRREWLDLAYAQMTDGTHDTEEGKRIRHEAWLTITAEETWVEDEEN